ncbi:MAG: nicotinate-nucleotide adenylyltransferase [Burkholderiales bacterium]|nr:nicotinate-nucleotide adenylyltransferase [Burkholderiales bacterium]
MGINLPRCVLVLGGSYDPVHLGHVALACCFADLLQADELRLVPAGQPWQKSGLTASAEHRIRMLELAFTGLPELAGVRLVIDQQEIQRALNRQASYSIDTLRNLRAEFGAETSIVFAMGADQLQNLHTWHDWRQLFEVAHLCAASRPGFSLDAVAPEVAQIWQQRAKPAPELRATPFGGTCLVKDLAQDVSATQLRQELKQQHPTTKLLVPHKVLDYLQQHSIYQ